MALLHYLISQRATVGYQLSVVHCEHGIRGNESVSDGLFVQETCQRIGVPCYYFAEDCIRLAKEGKMSVETAAREFRKRCFQTLLDEGKADYVATAHHQGDEAETVLFRLARGAALSGARGMSQESDRMIRPFLTWSRAEITAYAAAQNVAFREDKTNTDVAYTRNKIRHEVLPTLEEAVPGATVNLARFAVLAAEDDELLYELSAPLLSQVKGEWQVAFCEKKPLFTRACLTALKGLGLEKDYTAAHLAAVYRLQSSERGSVAVLPKNIRAEKREKGIVFYRYQPCERSVCAEEKKFSEEGYDGGMYEVNVFSCLPTGAVDEEKVLRIDGDKLPKNAVFRFRKEGDFIARFGGGEKSLKKFFNERKTPVDERARLPLIAEADGHEVYVVCGEEISEKVKVTADSRRILYIKTCKK